MPADRFDNANDDYWTQSKQRGFSFADTEDVDADTETGWAHFSKGEAARLSARLRERVGFDSAESPIAETSFGDLITAPLTGDKTPASSKISLVDRPFQPPKFEDLWEFTPEPSSAKLPEDSKAPKDIVRCILMGQPRILEHLRSLDEKLQLLDGAIKMHDGNAILAAVLFLKRTIKPSIFNQEMMQRPQAMNHYLSYLYRHFDHAELVDLLCMMGKTEEAGMLRYKLAIVMRSGEDKLSRLQNCYHTHFQSDPSVAFQAALLKEQVSLLECQRPIEEEDARQEREGNPVFQQLPRSSSLLNMSVVTTLYYCCLYHYNLAENNFASPKFIRKNFKLTDKQFMWTALAALARQGRWDDVHQLFQIKSFLGVKTRCCIGFDKAVQVLHQAKAPTEIISKYLQLVDSTEQRLSLAKKYKCHRQVIEVLVTLRDRQSLEEYCRDLHPHMPEYLQAQEHLRSPTAKWKN